MHQHATLEDTVYFWFASNDTGGSGDDGAAPLYDVRLGGAAAGAAPVLSGNGTLLTHANYPAGAHEIAVAATAANGFAAGNTYGVFCDVLVDGENPTGFAGSFTLGPIPSRLTAAGLQDVAQFMHRTTDTVSLLEAGVDNAKTAIEAAAAGDVVILGPGTFPIGDNQIEVPDGVIVKGAGIDVTVLTSTTDYSTGAILVPGDNSLIEDLTVEGIAADQMAVGSWSASGDQGFVNALVRRVKGVADTDSFYVNHTEQMSATLIDCIWHSDWDCIIFQGGAAGSEFDVINNKAVSVSTSECHGLRVSDADIRVRAFDLDIHLETSQNICRGVHSLAGTVLLFGGRIETQSAGVPAQRPALQQEGTGELIAIGVEYDRSKTAGTITEVSGLDAALGATPTANSIMQRIQAIDLLSEAAGAGDLAAALAAQTLILADTNMLQTDWVNGGRLDNILDAVVPGATIELTTEGENLITP